MKSKFNRMMDNLSNDYDATVAQWNEQLNPPAPVIEETSEVTAADGDEKELGNLTIRIMITPTYSGGEDQLSIQVYGWRNDDTETMSRTDLFAGDYEVEVATITLPSDGDFRTDDEVTFTLTQQQIDDALALYDELYMSDEETPEADPVDEPDYDSIDTFAIAQRASALARDRGFLTAGNILLTDAGE